MSDPSNQVYVDGPVAIAADGLNAFCQTVQTASWLRNFIGVTGMSVELLGITAIGDGLGGTFYWSATSVGPDDNLNTIVPFGSKQGAWLKLALTPAGGVFQAANYAAVRALMTGSAGTTLAVLGRSTPVDGGEGLFEYVASDTTTADNGGTVLVDASNRRWVRMANWGPYSVRWFGATGNGATDDFAAIVLAQTAAAAAGRGLWFPSGTYKTGTSLAFTVDVRMDPGARLAPAAATTLTLTSTLTAPLSQCFATGAGVTHFGIKVPAVYPQWFGAVGDNSTDCTTAFAATFASGAVNIRVPAGQYRLTGQPTYTMPTASSVLTMIGDGADQTELIWASGQGMVVNFISPFNSCHLRDFSCLIGTPGSSGQTGITLNQTAATPNSANSPLSDISGITCRGSDAYLATDYWGSGITSNGVSNIDFSNVAVAGSAVVAINISNGIVVQGTVTMPPVVFNFTGCYFTGVGIAVQYGTFVQGMTVSQSNFTDCAYGIAAQSAEVGLDQLAVSASQFACTHAGILTQTAVSSVTAIGNLFIVPDGAFGIDLEHANALMLVGNSFVPSGTAVGSIGIAVNATAAPVGTITGNSFLGMGGVAIQLGAATSGINVQSNAYSGNGSNVSNAGTNTIGGGSI